MAMLQRLFGSRRAPSLPRVSERTRIYAIGDIHGRLDLLAKLHGRIVSDARRFVGKKRIVYLGDYIDRGRDSCAVIEYLCNHDLEGFERVFLKGNHDAWMLDFLEDAEVGPDWFFNGGEVTLASYGVGCDDEGRPMTHLFDDVGELQKALKDMLPGHHREFLDALKLQHVEGNYLFVHAGIRPDVALEAQTPDDLMWIREPFLSSDDDFGKVVVHGHTPTPQAEMRANRIGIDTGACYGGALTCLVLEDDKQRLLTCKDQGHVDTGGR
jgi:serine/threonine protein phosphatase 1